MARNAAIRYEFSHTVESYATRIDEEPGDLAEPTVPAGIFAHAPALRALTRYLTDARGLTTAQTALLLGRTPQCIAASRHASQPLPAVAEDGLRIPTRVFRSPLPPLEALVTHLRSLGLRNIDIARLLSRDPRTTWTAAKRAEARR